MSLKFMYITNSPEVAKAVQKAGVDRIFVDLEILGKCERQKGQDTVISHHTIEDVRKIRPVLEDADLLVRVNPINENTNREVDEAVQAGADWIMLPMFKTKEDVRVFLDAVRGRTKTILLIETKEAVANLDDYLYWDEIDEFFVGLNDLHRSYGLSIMFELLVNGTLETVCNKIQSTGKPFGFGGIAKLGQGQILSNYILGEHYRMGSSRVILSRTFCNSGQFSDMDELERMFKKEIQKIQRYEHFLSYQEPSFYRGNSDLLAANIQDVKDSLSDR